MPRSAAASLPFSSTPSHAAAGGGRRAKPGRRTVAAGPPFFEARDGSRRWGLGPLEHSSFCHGGWRLRPWCAGPPARSSSRPWCRGALAPPWGAAAVVGSAGVTCVLPPASRAGWRPPLRALDGRRLPFPAAAVVLVVARSGRALLAGFVSTIHWRQG